MAIKEEQKTVPYQVLARKYRPQNFDDLIGQDALVRTLKNAIESGRIAHAFMLTGIRGVGKTTTARIIAKALNYTGPDGKAGPTTGDTSDCGICQAIAQDRHPDVMEMDAASRTGIDDIREILDGVRYAPTSARYKVYIIDEVHMLSKAAFNALLKTLEEPPEHVKFIFATTEIRKVPITVLSRCQRFDLRRIEPDVLADYYGKIASKENTDIEDQALTMIARAADGSVRDGLSLLDQSIALGDGEVTAEQVKEMLGLADRTIVMDLLETALKGLPKETLEIAQDLYKKGADPIIITQDLLSLSHILTKHRAIPDLQNNGLLSEAEEDRLNNLSAVLSMPTLNRTWQILLKGLNEITTAPDSQNAFEMVLLRLTYAANLPDPAELVKKLTETGDANKQIAAAKSTASISSTASSTSIPSASLPNNSPSNEINRQPHGQNQPQTSAQLKPSQDNNDTNKLITNLRDVVRVLEDNGAMVVASDIYMHAHLVEMKENTIELRLSDLAPQRLAQDLSQALKSATGERWIISVSAKVGNETLAQKDEAKEIKLKENIMQEPIMRNIMKLFPDAEVTNITKK